MNSKFGKVDDNGVFKFCENLIPEEKMIINNITNMKIKKLL